MSAIAGILAGIAAKVGAGLVEKVLGDRFGPAGGKLAETVIGEIAERAGVSPPALPELAGGNAADRRIVEKAVTAVEAGMPELILAHVEQQREANRLMLAEMDKEPVWAWAWRPGWMWLLALMWLCRLLVIPVADGISGGDIAGSIDISVMLTLTGYFLALYMGGHTLKDLGTKAIDAYRSRP